jgi:hypothetical protein
MCNIVGIIYWQEETCPCASLLFTNISDMECLELEPEPSGEKPVSTRVMNAVIGE